MCFSGPHTFNRQGTGNRVTSVGFSVPGVHTKLANTDSDGTGEVSTLLRIWIVITGAL